MLTTLDCSVVAVARDFTRSLDPETEADVTAIWDRASADLPALVDGMIFSVDRIDAPTIHGTFVPYRWFYAQHEAPELYTRLAVVPLAVTGRVMTDDGRWVLGRRSARTTQDRLLWEFVPSGGVDSSARTDSGIVDLKAALRRELDEELGILESADTTADAVGLVVDSRTHVVDVVFDVAVPRSSSELQRELHQRQTFEHDDFRFVEPADARDQFASSALAPATREMLGLPPRIGAR